MSIDNSTTLTRRRFLTKGVMAASAVALPYYVPASAMGLGGTVAPSERIVMGGIGMGGRGSSDLGWMLNEPDVHWVAVCDVRSRQLTVANPDVMYRAMNICLAADICERLKRNLKFDLRKAEFVGDPEANRMRSRAMRAPYII